MSNRVTNSMMINTFVRNMNTNMLKMDKYTSQLSSNRKIVHLSDDPVGVFDALTARQRLQRYDQYKSTLITARNWNEQADSTLQEVSARLTDLKEQLIYATDNATKTPEDRANIGAYVAELKKNLVSGLNAAVGNQYIFAGYNTYTAPFTIEEATGKVMYNGIDLTDETAANMTKIEYEQSQYFTLEVGYSLDMEVGINGVDVVGIGDKNMFKVLDDILELMTNGSDDTQFIHDLSAQIEKVEALHDNVLAQEVRVGAISNNIKTLDDRYDQDIINYSTIRSEVEDIDSAEAIMDWKMAEAVYKQSLSAGARVIQPTLMDFLN